MTDIIKEFRNGECIVRTESQCNTLGHFNVLFAALYDYFPGVTPDDVRVVPFSDPDETTQLAFLLGDRPKFTWSLRYKVVGPVHNDFKRT